MRILINDIAASTGGAMTVLKDFYAYIRDNETEHEWIFLLGDYYLEETERIKVIALPDIKRSRVKKLVFDFLTGRKYIGELHPDAVLSLQNTITFGVQVPQFVYIHQSIPFQKQIRFSFLKRDERSLAVIQYMIGAVIKLSAAKSDGVFVQTKWMKEAVGRQCAIPESKIIQVLPDVGDILCAVQESSFDPKCFFYPTAEQSYKNNECVFCASEILRAKNIEHHVVMTLPECCSSGNVSCIGKIPRQEVLERYAGATLVFPSYIETFGYPLAEARKVGTIILASDCPFSREVLEDYENACFFDPFKPEELAMLMEAVALGKIKRKQMDERNAFSCDNWIVILNELKSKIDNR